MILKKNTPSYFQLMFIRLISVLVNILTNVNLYINRTIDGLSKYTETKVIDDYLLVKYPVIDFRSKAIQEIDSSDSKKSVTAELKIITEYDNRKKLNSYFNDLNNSEEPVIDGYILSMKSDPEKHWTENGFKIIKKYHYTTCLAEKNEMTVCKKPTKCQRSYYIPDDLFPSDMYQEDNTPNFKITKDLSSFEIPKEISGFGKEKSTSKYFYKYNSFN